MLYNLPKDLDIEFIVGTTLQMVGVTKFAVCLYFDNQASFTVESAFKVNNVYFKVPCFDLSMVKNLIDLKVSSVSHDESNIFLCFGDDTLEICGERDGYESYQFNSSEINFVV